MQPLKLEIFVEDKAQDPLTADPEGAGQNSAGFESGYQAGWEDATATLAREADQDAAEVTRALQSLEFTFHDARAHLLRGLAPLFEEIVARLLPKIALEGLPHLISDVLLPLAEQATEAPVEVLVHPGQRDAVAAHLARLPHLPFILVDAPEHPPARISLRLGESETRIDVEAAITAIDHLLRSYFDPPAQEARHG